MLPADSPIAFITPISRLSDSIDASRTNLRASIATRITSRLARMITAAVIPSARALSSLKRFMSRDGPPDGRPEEA